MKRRLRLHDRAVCQLANQLLRQGWEVKADCPNSTYLRPKPIGKDGHIPDIVARKAGAKRIYEVETPQSYLRDQKQLSTFRRSAAHQSRTKFIPVIVKTKLGK